MIDVTGQSVRHVVCLGIQSSTVFGIVHLNDLGKCLVNQWLDDEACGLHARLIRVLVVGLVDGEHLLLQCLDLLVLAEEIVLLAFSISSGQ